jgi:transposase
MTPVSKWVPPRWSNTHQRQVTPPARAAKLEDDPSSSAVRLVLDHEHEHPSRWATIVSVSAKIGCTAQTLLEWVKKAEVDSGKRAGVPIDMAEKQRENRELRQANEILRKASAYFAQAELDRRVKP